MSERLHEPERKTLTLPAASPLPMAPATDVATLADTALAPVAVAPDTVTVTVKTTGASATTIVATPDTPLSDVMTQACTALGVRDPGSYLLVARGEVLANLRRTLGQIAAELTGALTMRLVTRPEAGEGTPRWRC